MMGDIGTWEGMMVMMLVGLIYIAIPAVILYAAIKAFSRIFRQLDQIQEDVRSIKAEGHDAAAGDVSEAR